MLVNQIRVELARAAARIALFAVPAAYAQEGDEDETGSAATEAEASEIEEVTVTGSRLKRDTFTSISPLQVISGQVSREIGLIDPTQILQESTAASGIQTDLTFASVFRTTNGPGATNVDLRGLGASRTLVLVNGRRLAPSGVEGAPTTPDSNLIPGSMVQQYEVLLDGASSVYGSDAVAGVVNVILRKDFDGLELELFSNIPAAGNSAGSQNQISAAWGHNGDRGFVGIGAEYRKVDPLTLADRKWTDQCDRHAEITTAGETRSRDVYWNTTFNMKPFGDCKFGAAAGFANTFDGRMGSLLRSPGTTNIGIPGWSDYSAYSVPVDTTRDGLADVSFVDINMNGAAQYAQIIPELKTTSVLAYGEYTFNTESNLTPYFELQYNRRESDYIGDPGNVGVAVPAQNPFNPCNPAAVNGVDCGSAYDTLLTDPGYVQDFSDYYVENFGCFGLPAEFCTPANFGLLSGPTGPQPFLPVFTVRGDRDNSVTDLDQIRAVVGIRGDMPFMNFGSFDDWSFDFYVSDTESDGTSSRVGIRSDRLNLSQGIYSSTSTPCENDTGEELVDDAATGCVPVNLFAPSLYANLVNNDFATVEERNYLFDSRDFRTKYGQTIYSLYANGEIFSLPAGDVLFGLGLEYREDEIESLPDEVAAEGLLQQFFVDKGAVGEKYTREFFAELELPLLADMEGIKELTINGSTRYTEDEFYGGAWTYSAKIAYRPADAMLFRGTVGTSYRAPNLRENFLAGQTGFIQITDPCVVSEDAFDVEGNYDPTLDIRSPTVIANCVADPNVDPFTFTNFGTSRYVTEASEGGATDLAEEKSESWSAGLVWEQPFFSSFDLVFGVTYYEIDIKDEIIDPSLSFILNDCYGDLEGDSPFCSRISRNSSGALVDPSQINLIDQGFINRDKLKARGADFNLRFDMPTQMFNRAVDLGAEFIFNRNYETSSRIIEGGAGDETDDFTGEFGYPKWKGRVTLRADVGDFRWTWSTRYISSVEQDADGIGDFSNIYEDAEIDTCFGPDAGDVNCRNIGFADKYFVHDASVYYFGDVWTFGAGIRNLLNEAPPFVDSQEVSSFNNVPIGAGYDIFGRTAFVDVVYNWQ
jgi:iron complex outermembrane receptor protein